MKVAFHLRKTADPASASAVLVEAERVGPLLALLARIGSDPAPPVHRVAGGYLVLVGDGPEPPPGPTRLRRLAENLYLPVDADLVPPLLDDEARALGRDRGLVFLPGGRVLGFDPARPVALSSLLVAERRETSGDWRPFPDRPARAERIVEVAWDRPATTAQVIIGGASDDGDPSGIGADGPPRPEASGAGRTLMGRAAMGLGKGLIGLGALVGSRALAGLGASWVAGAIGRVPRLTEALLGRQEGALRELLRQFREGDVEKALRHALPLNGDGGRGEVAATGDQLPSRDTAYSLQALLGSGRGAAGVWHVAADVQAELAREYRKAADAAEKSGDFRRAALIRGRLLNDTLAAARLLEKGGLHHDAAILYLDRLDDAPNAARCFEAAGAFDRALRLYRDRRLHAEAGDLLRRLGEEEDAVAEYVLAAGILSADPRRDHLAAGDLLRDRARRPDLALPEYARGWEARSSANAVACALRMARLHADGKATDPLLALVDEADDWFARPGHAAEANEFYNDLATLAESDRLASVRDDLRDRSLMGLATQLRRASETHTHPGPLISSFLGRRTVWSADVVADATHALSAAMARPRPAPAYRPPPRRIAVGGYGTVTAACHAPGSGDLFLGFEGGSVVKVHVATGEVSRIAENEDVGIPDWVACDFEGRIVISLNSDHTSNAAIWRRSPGSGDWYERRELVDWRPGLHGTPIIHSGGPLGVGILCETGFSVRGCNPHLDEFSVVLSVPCDQLALIHLVPDEITVPWLLLVHDGSDWCYANHMSRVLSRRPAGWCPHRPDDHPLRAVPMSWLDVDSRHLEVVGFDNAGSVCWSSIRLDGVETIPVAKYHGGEGSSYRAVAMVRLGLVAAAGRGRVDWLRRGAKGLAPIGSADLDLAEVAACFANPRTRELVVVGADGTIACVSMPD